MTPKLLYTADGCEVWHGDCLDPETVGAVMQGRRADLLHVDAPYSERTHAGHREGKVTADRASGFAERHPINPRKAAEARYAAKAARQDIEYAAWSRAEVDAFNAAWLPVTQGWATTITDHVLAPEWSESFAAAGLYVFAPLPWVETGSRCRMVGDGPSSWACWTVVATPAPWSCSAVVARPRGAPYSKWGTLDGAYIGPTENKQNRPHRITGGKSLALTTKFLSDYSRRGDLVLDPCLGGGTTIMAARMSGRRCIGIEKDEGRAELCARLLATKREQFDLFGT